jgi:hypothetical protein
MAKVQPGRYTANHDGEVVVFIIGMRINKFLKPNKWVPVARSMGPMIKELMTHPDKGLMGYEIFWRGRQIVLIQYWKSFDALNQFARATDDPHLPAWRAFNKSVGTSGDVGIFHETYVVSGGAESVYGNMVPFGLGKATGVVPIAQKGQAAAYRAGVAPVDEPFVPVPE